MGNYADKLMKKNPDQKFTIVSKSGKEKTFNGGNKGGKDKGNKDKGGKVVNTPTAAPEMAKPSNGPKMMAESGGDYLGNIPQGYTKKVRTNWRDKTGMGQNEGDKPFFKHSQKGMR